MNRTILKNIGIYAGILLLFIGLAYGFRYSTARS